MDNLLRKIIYWGAGLSICALLVVGGVRMQLDSESRSPLTIVPSSLEGETSIQSTMLKVNSSEQISGVLIPLGPNDGRLPGVPSVWRDFQSVQLPEKTTQTTGGFDGLQAVADISELSNGAVSELFLAAAPKKVFRSGRFLYLLNDKNQLLAIDCNDPGKPDKIGTLGYVGIKDVAIQGSVAYLLLKRPETSTGMMVVVDLKKNSAPKELARVELPETASSLFFVNSQLVVYSSGRGPLGHNRVYLYDVDDARISLRGSEESPYLGEDLLQYDNYILAPGLTGGLTIYDFNSPLNPEQISFLETPVLNRLANYGSMIFATGLGGELLGINLENAAHPVLSSVTEGVAHSAFFLEQGNYLYFFTLNGYLRVFNLSHVAFKLPEKPESSLDGDLVALPNGKGFILVGRNPVSLREGVARVLSWPETRKVVDHLVWQDSLVVLDDDGLLSFFRPGEDDSLIFWHRLQLEGTQRWLAANDRYLCAGGARSLEVVVDNGDETVSKVGKIDLSGKESWDGVVLQNTLILAAGKDGLLIYSLQQPMTPLLTSSWMPPRHVQGEVDVRSLAVADTDRILFSADHAGLFSGRVDGDRGFVLEGSLRLASSAHMLAVHDGLALVATEANVTVVDIRESHSFQTLGEIAFPAVEKIAVATSGLWAGYTASTGWSLLSLPRFLRPEDKNLLTNDYRIPCLKESSYRLNLFDAHEVKQVSGFVHSSFCQIRHPAAGGSHGL
jgi:hypothetical protein